MPDRTGAQERWRAVVEYKGYYQVSDRGHVRSVDRLVVTRNGRTYHFSGVPLSPSTDPIGRQMVCLTRGGRGRTLYVHHLVLEAFVGPRPKGLMGCHDNGDPADNWVGNLRWDTQHENMLDKGRHGTDHCRNRDRCPLGHLLTAPNLVAWQVTIGHRSCLACARARAAGQYARRKGCPFDLRVVAAEKYRVIMGSAAA